MRRRKQGITEHYGKEEISLEEKWQAEYISTESKWEITINQEKRY
jgi:hypothetical protein